MLKKKEKTDTSSVNISSHTFSDMHVSGRIGQHTLESTIKSFLDAATVNESRQASEISPLPHQLCLVDPRPQHCSGQPVLCQILHKLHSSFPAHVRLLRQLPKSLTVMPLCELDDGISCSVLSFLSDPMHCQRCLPFSAPSVVLFY